MNFNLLRYLAVFTGAFILILVLIVIQGALLFLISDLGVPGISGYRFVLFWIAVMLFTPFVSDYFDYAFVFLFGAFAVASFLEGKRYQRSNSTIPSGLAMVSLPFTMAFCGVCAVGICALLIGYLLTGQLSFWGGNLSAWQYFILCAYIVFATLICRVSFGIGLKKAQILNTKGEHA